MTRKIFMLSAAVSNEQVFRRSRTYEVSAEQADEFVDAGIARYDDEAPAQVRETATKKDKETR